MESNFLRFIKDDRTYLERQPLEKTSKKKQLIAFKHQGFWQCVDKKRFRQDKKISRNKIKKKV